MAQQNKKRVDKKRVDFALTLHSTPKILCLSERLENVLNALNAST